MQPGRNKPASKADEKLSSLIEHAIFSKACGLARAGDYAPAAELLWGMTNNGAENPRALDCLARISAQRGRLTEAERLWNRALVVDPGNEAYQAGLRRIEWLQRRSQLIAGVVSPVTMTAAILIPLLLAVFLIQRGVNNFRDSVVASVTKSVSSQMAVIQPSPATRTSEEAKTPQSGQLARIAAAIALPGAKVTQTGDRIEITFNDGLFDWGAVLTPEAKESLAKFAGQFRPFAEDVSLQVIGCTDNRPVEESPLYTDNVALGLARAVAVQDYLRREGGLPAGVFHLKSLGDTYSPFPNDGYANRSRNRTVVLRISVGDLVK